ncbi:MAG: nucleoside-diphosphate sugar epimerase/dehydratase [Steroidobacteraceae bacterium]
MTSVLPRWIARLARRLVMLPRANKRVLMLLADALFIPAALWSAIALKTGSLHSDLPESLWVYPIAVLASVPVFARLGLYRAVLRYIGARAIVAVLAGVTVSVALLVAVNLFTSRGAVPPAAFVIYWAFALVYVGGSRLLIRSLMHFRSLGTERVAIYGAGKAGAQLLSALFSSGRYYPVAFVDDNRALHGSLVNGVEVCSADELPELVSREGVTTVLLALPSQTRRRRQEILREIEPLGVRVQTVPDIGDIIAGKALVEDVRDVDATDLLGRDPVPPNETLLDACIRGKVVMVTGAGGSIGSELCRQILRLAPSRLLMFEMSELALYNIERELQLIAAREDRSVDVVALLGNAHHRERVREVVQAYGVQTIYHAAAYKHVPIVERNLIEGVHNNVMSTWHAAEAALACRVETFVLVSTDKAVNPTNVMGATKRLAEIVLQGMQSRERNSPTRFCMVRFGNVLESSGSVVPLFREQIRNGGPVTVTHKNVTRYFMTIPEAAQLVLQAGSMAKGGEVFVLDMGKPVRIKDLARRMVNVMGLTVRDDNDPDGDIEIVYTGLRPGEKLFEELLIGDNVAGTAHPMIMRAMEHSLPWPMVQQILDDLLHALDRSDCRRARDLLVQAVAEYRPEVEIQDLVWSWKASALSDSRKVTELHAHRPR